MKRIKNEIIVLTLIIISLFSINLFAIENSTNKLIQDGSTLYLNLEKKIDIFENNSFVFAKSTNDGKKKYEIEFYENIKLSCLNFKSIKLCNINFNNQLYGIDIKTKENIDKIISSGDIGEYLLIQNEQNNIYTLTQNNKTICMYKFIESLNIYIEYSINLKDENAIFDTTVVDAVKRISLTNKEPFNIVEKYNKVHIENFGTFDIENINTISNTSIIFNIKYKDTFAQFGINYGDAFYEDIFKDNETILSTEETEKNELYFIKTANNIGISEFGFTDSEFTIRGNSFPRIVVYVMNRVVREKK